MTDAGMPWAVVNMGSEMLYILEQRLQAQSISDDKSTRVLQDVISTMFSDTFLSELFKPQRMYTATATRQIFDQLAHSSIMRLNSSSMDKLYDLMTMAVKAQLVLSSSPFDLSAICYNHIDTLKKLQLSTESKKLIDKAFNNLNLLYNTFNYADFFQLRLTLARFYQDKRIKVSLFLQENMQLADGNIAVVLNGTYVPVNTEVPGKVTYYDYHNAITKTDVLKLTNSCVKERSPTERCELGLNLYAKDKRKKQRAAAAAGGPAPATATASTQKRLDKGKEEYDALIKDEKDKEAAKTELNALAALISTGAKSSGSAADKVTIDSLFPNLTKDDNTDANPMLVFDSEDHAARMREMTKRLGEFDMKENNEGQEDDLLDLMDRAN